MNFKTRVYNAVTTYISKLDEMNAAEKEIAAQERAEKIGHGYACERREELEAQRKAAYENALAEIEHIRRSHNEAVDAWDEMDGSKLDKDAELLKLDISMTQKQYQQLVDKHKDNSLMLQLLCDYADRHPEEPLFADRPADAKTRKDNFDEYCNRAASACRNPSSISAAMFLDDNGVPASVSYEY